MATSACRCFFACLFFFLPFSSGHGSPRCGHGLEAATLQPLPRSYSVLWMWATGERCGEWASGIDVWGVSGSSLILEFVGRDMTDSCLSFGVPFLSRVFHKMLYGFQGVPTRERDTASKKRDLSKETKLKLFLKRSSEPILNIQFPQVSYSLTCPCATLRIASSTQSTDL